MPLYELVCISSGCLRELASQKLVKMAALHVLDNGGVVKSLNYLAGKT